MDQPSMESAAESPSPPPVEVERRPSVGAVLEENGEQEVEPQRNGAEHSSETESSDSIHPPAVKEPLIKTVPRKAISLHSLVSHMCICQVLPLKAFLLFCRACREEWQEAVRQRLPAGLPVHACVCAETRGAPSHF